jgi:pimeloyl-ACP methyl ester carboxylesterase
MPPGPVTVDGPMLVVAGSDDSHCPREALSSLATNLPAATVTMIDGSDHFFFAGLDALEAALAAWAGKVAG